MPVSVSSAAQAGGVAVRRLGRNLVLIMMQAAARGYEPVVGVRSGMRMVQSRES